MSFNGRFLLIDGASGSRWHQALQSALTQLGALEAVEEQEAISRLGGGEYNLVIIDATAVANVPQLVREVRANGPNLPLLVASASPDWEQAREIFRAGATDYILKSHEEEKLRTAVREALGLIDSHDI